MLVSSLTLPVRLERLWRLQLRRLHSSQFGILPALGSIFGRPLKIDHATSTGSKPSVARVLVELDVSKYFPDKVWVGPDILGFIQSVVMEELPSYCSHCKSLGHSKLECHFLHPQLVTCNIVGAEPVNIGNKLPLIVNHVENFCSDHLPTCGEGLSVVPSTDVLCDPSEQVANGIDGSLIGALSLAHSCGNNVDKVADCIAPTCGINEDVSEVCVQNNCLINVVASSFIPLISNGDYDGVSPMDGFSPTDACDGVAAVSDEIDPLGSGDQVVNQECLDSTASLLEPLNKVLVDVPISLISNEEDFLEFEDDVQAMFILKDNRSGEKASTLRGGKSGRRNSRRKLRTEAHSSSSSGCEEKGQRKRGNSIDSFTEFGATFDYRMAATLNNKIKRRNLEKLNIPLICEEILNPSIPMALRLSGILMGGVVNVYKRKVDFLYDDVNRFLEEFNRAFKANNAGDSNNKTQAKRKAQAKSEAAITIPDKENFEVDMEQYTIHPSNPLFDVARFQKMTLKDLDDHYINIDIGGDDLSVHRQHHQADPADITLPDKVDLGTIHAGSFDRFDRFDIGDDTFMEADFTSQVLPDTPPQVPQSPPPPQEPVHGLHDQFTTNLPTNPHIYKLLIYDLLVDAMEHKQMEVENQPPEEVDQEQKISAIKEPAGVYHHSKRKVRGNSVRVIIDEQTMIPSETYQSWLSDTSDISSLRRKRKTKVIFYLMHFLSTSSSLDI
ncbi:hypothetical protein M5K25_018820 [Dendrobium thyrsiflorum]|uniref:Rad21/Rec8-like protein N-terminal domain-containing protein n=1 Tax=Dendrobium thyrsiflorum TaxID=117978 RepID=A0ABD0UK51_DENTH